jgi:hypothetical protein
METCTDCGAPATCRYDRGTGERLGCVTHDPMHWPYFAMVRVPSFYQSIPQFPVLATTGHLGIDWGWQHGNTGITPHPTIGITPPERMTVTAGTGC